MQAQSKVKKVPNLAADVPDIQADIEGHSVFPAIVTSGLLRARAPREGQSAGTKTDEALPPLTKPFPSMRDDRRK
jgi:hypothetical protein